MSKRSPPGQSVLKKLAQRDLGGLRRRQMPDGGEVYSGATASRALRALGARAFTMDSKIFVPDDFDPGRPEDQALYAHERHHQLNSGGEGAPHGFHDAEEKASRAIERMVLHRASQGEDFGSILRDVEANRFRTEGDVAQRASRSVETTTASGDTKVSGMQSAEAAMAALLAGDRPYDAIIEDLASEIIGSLSSSGGTDALQGRSVGFV